MVAPPQVVAPDVYRVDAIASLGSGLENLKRNFVTHQHDDHTGGPRGLLEWAPHAEVGATAHESEVISGRHPYDPQNNAVLRHASRRAAPPGVPVTKVLREDDLVSGFRVISTPGHTPGHVSSLRDADGPLFTADALGCLPRKIRVGVRRFACVESPLAGRSAEKLLGEALATVVLAHGKPLREGAKDTLRELVARCRY